MVSLCHENGFKVGNVDLTIIAQHPKLAPHLAEMRKNLSGLLQTPEDCIGIKATTHEGIGSLGREEGIAAHAVCLLFKT